MGIISQQLGEYKHPGNHLTPNEEWYRCEYRNCPVYLYVQIAADGSPPSIKTALQLAYEQQAYGVRIIRNAITRRPEMETCELKPFVSRFNSELEPVVHFSSQFDNLYPIWHILLFWHPRILIKVSRIMQSSNKNMAHVTTGKETCAPHVLGTRGHTFL